MHETILHTKAVQECLMSLACGRFNSVILTNEKMGPLVRGSLKKTQVNFLQRVATCPTSLVWDMQQHYNFCISNILTKYKQATTHRKQRQTVSMGYRSCNQEVRRITQCKTESQSLETNHTQQDTHCKRSYKTSENLRNKHKIHTVGSTEIYAYGDCI